MVTTVFTVGVGIISIKKLGKYCYLSVVVLVVVFLRRSVGIVTTFVLFEL